MHIRFQQHIGAKLWVCRATGSLFAAHVLNPITILNYSFNFLFYNFEEIRLDFQPVHQKAENPAGGGRLSPAGRWNNNEKDLLNA
jgi:hypothetical protein